MPLKKGVIALPQRRSGIKELRKSRKKKLHNLDIKTDLRKTIKTFLKSVKENSAAEAKANLSILYKKLDKAAKRNIMNDNTASRRKSYYTKLASKIK